MKTKHTPGPWKVHQYNAGVVGIHGLNKAIDIGPSGLAVATVIGAFEQPAPGAEAEANARLIAAAPEMLEALKLCREAIWQLSPTGNDEEYSKAWVKACAEIDQRCKTLIARIESGEGQ